MEMFLYKTRGNSDPQGKPRVYFCCHPEDVSTYLEPIANEILEAENCAFWYAGEAIPRDAAFLAALKQMQLFVMPVTAKLLTTENPALDAEFRFAQENHIPVLPLLQEQGLDTLFSGKCGNLQYLDRFQSDATGISYKEKLRNFLDAVLVGDALAEQIRAAFDAYVFLSYRKKDRAHAEELMRLIHQNEFCRDIAIWYDEFLTPGEDFNDSIQNALAKSGLFVLAVTPNVVNEPNYIMTTEYPMARREGKTILPAEMVPTDKTVLAREYEGLPDPTDAHNSEQLSEALAEALGRIVIRENDRSPEHNFFIGLAYLNGIDVEIDRERGVSLIESAAEGGLLAAADHLFGMYLNGIGVPRDISQATAWLERTVTLAMEQFRQEKTYENTRVWIDRLAKLARHLETTVGSLTATIRAYDDLGRLCKRAYGRFPMLELKRQMGACALKQAQLYQKKGNMDYFAIYAASAIECLEAVRKELEEQLAGNVAAITLRDLADYYSLFGLLSDMAFTQAACRARKNDLAGEETYVQKGVEAAEYMAAHLKGDEQVRLSLAGAYSNAAKFYIRNKRWAEAQPYLEKGHALATEIGQITHWLPAGDLVITFRTLKATVFREQGAREASLNCWLENIRDLENSSLTPAMKGQLAYHYETVSELAFDGENYPLCGEMAEKGLRLYSEILSNADFVKVQTKLCRMLAVSEAKNGHGEMAIRVARKLFDVKYTDYSENSCGKTALEYSESTYLLAKVYQDAKEYGSAVLTYENGIKFSKTVMLMYPEVGDVNLENTVAACLDLAEVYAAMEKTGKSVKWMKEAITIRKRVHKAKGEPRAAEKLADCYCRCARLLEAQKKPQKAKSFRQAAEELK